MREQLARQVLAFLAGALVASGCGGFDGEDRSGSAVTPDQDRIGSSPTPDVVALPSLPTDPDAVLGVVPGYGVVHAGTGGFDGGGTITVRAIDPSELDAPVEALPPPGVTSTESTISRRDLVGTDPSEEIRDESSTLRSMIEFVAGEGSVRAGPGLDIEVEGQFGGQLTVRLDANPPPDDDLLPAVVHVHDDGRLSVEPAYWDEETGQIVTQAGDFSFSIPWWLNPVNWVAGIIDGVSDYLTGRTDPPRCGSPAPVWARLQSPDGVVHTCFQTNVDAATGRERAELYLKSNRRTTLVVERPDDAAYAWVEGQPEWAQPLIAQLTGKDADRHILVTGGQALSFGFDQPELEDRTEQMEMETTIQTGLLDSLMYLLGASGNDIVSVALTLNACVVELVGVDALGGDFSIDFDWRSVFGSMVDCALTGLVNMVEPGVALGVVEDLESLGAITSFPKDALARGAAIDHATRSAQRLARVAEGILKAGPALVGVWDQFFDNRDDGTRAVVSLASIETLEPPTLKEIAIPEPSASEAPVMIVVDRSGSMSEELPGGVKIDVAKAALLDFVEGANPDTPVGLWTYPAGGNCGTGASAVRLAERDPVSMSPVIRTLTPDGDTPTAEALTAAWQSMIADGYDAGTLILVSDGESTCDDPCSAARELAASNFSVQFVGVGFGAISEAGQQELDCIADVTLGTSVQAEDDDGLRDVIDDASRPDLSVRLEHPSEAVVEVGNTPEGNIEVSARIENTSSSQAENVIAALRFDSGNPGVAAPVRALGNLNPADSATVTWSFRPSLLTAGQSVAFTVVVVADNLDAPVEASGQIELRNLDAAADAGDLLSSGLVILGDSFSAGEGADGYINGTDIDQNRCHRSRHTYLVDLLDIPSDHLLACSGAVAQDLHSPNTGNNVAAQLDQLRQVGERPAGPPPGVVMTMGGNDVGFADVIIYCLVLTCSDIVSDAFGLDLPDVNTGDGYIIEKFQLESFSTSEGPTTFAGMMADHYARINEVLNSHWWKAERGTVAPIIVLAYPRPVPSVDVSCPILTGFVNQAELTFATRFVATLNANIEAAVDAAHADGVPVYFVPNTEDAFAPNHTICDDKPYARSLQSLNGAGIDLGSVIRDIRGTLTFDPSIGALTGGAGRAVQELFHPNQAGYDALTGAILRWSQSAQAQAAETELAAWSAEIEDSVPLDPPQPTVTSQWDSSTTDLGQLVPGERLQPGTSYPLSVQGYAPLSPLTLEVRSDPTILQVARANLDGHATLEVGIPSDLPPGKHTLVVSGVGPSGETRSVSVAFTVATAWWRDAQRLLILASVGFLVLAAGAYASELLRRRRSKRPPTAEDEPVGAGPTADQDAHRPSGRGSEPSEPPETQRSEPTEEAT